MGGARLGGIDGVLLTTFNGGLSDAKDGIVPLGLWTLMGGARVGSVIGDTCCMDISVARDLLRNSSFFSLAILDMYSSSERRLIPHVTERYTCNCGTMMLTPSTMLNWR